MKTNIGGADRIFRVIIAAVFIGLYFANIISGWLGIALIVLSVVFLLTSLVGFCPLYLPFGIKTNKN